MDKYKPCFCTCVSLHRVVCPPGSPWVVRDRSTQFKREEAYRKMEYIRENSGWCLYCGCTCDCGLVDPRVAWPKHYPSQVNQVETMKSFYENYRVKY